MSESPYPLPPFPFLILVPYTNNAFLSSFAIQQIVGWVTIKILMFDQDFSHLFLYVFLCGCLFGSKWSSHAQNSPILLMKMKKFLLELMEFACVASHIVDEAQPFWHLQAFLKNDTRIWLKVFEAQAIELNHLVKWYSMQWTKPWSKAFRRLKIEIRWKVLFGNDLNGRMNQCPNP